MKVRGRQAGLYLDGQLWGGFTDDRPAEPFRQVASRDARTGEEFACTFAPNSVTFPGAPATDRDCIKVQRNV
ncbi:hypothetical protein [Streptomyces sp. NPDC006997]|uniref:hypothetical protein n=1 Tax=Streptomyces sp. NPDC006997 TaxID=3155356 RepID=UPI0033FEFF41